MGRTLTFGDNGVVISGMCVDVGFGSTLFPNTISLSFMHHLLMVTMV